MLSSLYHVQHIPGTSTVFILESQPLLLMQVKIVVFDKTGTLTIGKPVVVSAVLFSKISMEELCDMAIAVEVLFKMLHSVLYFSFFLHSF